MRCPVHCPPAVSGLAAPLRALAALAVVAGGVWVLAQVAWVLAAAAAVVAVLAVPARRVLVWSARLALVTPNTVAIVIRRGGLPAPRWPDRPALTAGPLAIESGLPAGQDDPEIRAALQAIERIGRWAGQ